MKTGVILTGTGPILLLTTCNSFEDPNVVSCLQSKGVNKYIVFEVPVDMVKTQYGQHFQVSLADRKQTDTCRVIDVDGSRIFQNFPLSVYGEAIMHEEPAIRKAA